MIDVKTAQNLVMLQSPIASKSQVIDLNGTMDFVLAMDVVSEMDMPPFRQSAMDGYAVHIGDSNTYKVIDEIKAGDAKNTVLRPGEAVRIFTGAPVPDSANTVVMQEKVRVSDKVIVIDPPLNIDDNIRPKGEQIRAGAIALNKGTKINAAHIGFLSSLGVTEVTVYKKPIITIVITGNELVSPGQKLDFGEIYESNGAMLTAVLSGLGYKDTTLANVGDDYDHTQKVLQEAIKNSDVVLVTGGISVGDYDFVGQALKAIDVEEVFYKVNQKPGKPLYFGKKGQVSIFALPGNPAAALNCFYIYVYPLLRKREGANHTQLTRITMPLSADYSVKGSRDQFLKAKVARGEVQILGGQSSAMLSAFGDANALVYLPGTLAEVKKETLVETILLPIK